MILGFTIAQVAVACIVGIACIVLGLVKRAPSDWTLGGVALVELLLIAQLFVGVVAPLAGNPPLGSLPEFWVYLVSALLIPPLAAVWALVDRSRWSTVVLGVAALAIAVMVYRMQQIWLGAA